MQRHAERETREMEPPLETVKTLHRREDRSHQIRTVPGTMEAELEGLQSQVAARKEAIQLRKNASRPELGEPAKRERREATATGSR